MEDTATIEAEKPVDAPIDTKPAETAKAGTQDTAKASDDGKGGDKTKPAGEADKAKEFVADSTKSDEENAKARDEFDKANPKDDDKPGLPDDWREIAAAGDDAALKMLKRYGSMSGVIKKMMEQEKIISSGKLKQPMPDPKDDKAMAEWRKSNGVPDDPTGYKLPETVTKRLTDDDKPMLSSYTDYMHKKGATPDEVARGTEWYIDMVEAIQAKQIEDDRNHSSEAEETLRKDLAHGEYKPTLTIAKRFVDTIPGIGENILGSRAPDGRLYGSIPEFVLWAAEQGREKFGDVAFSTSDGERKHTARKEEIEKVMNTDIDRYYAEGLDKEYAKITERETKRK